MEILYIVLIVLGACFLLLIGYVIAAYDYRKYIERLQVNLCDANAEILEYQERLKNVKKSYYQVARNNVELENNAKYLRQANVEISAESFMEGKKAGRQELAKEMADILIKESNVLNDSGGKKLIPNQLVNIGSGL
jgi:hypothetical protein